MMVPGMQVAFVVDGMALRRKSLGELRFDRGLDGQGRFPSPYEDGSAPPTSFRFMRLGDHPANVNSCIALRRAHNSQAASRQERMKPYSKYFEKIKVRPDPQAEVKAHAPACQWDGCNEAGTEKGEGGSCFACHDSSPSISLVRSWEEFRGGICLNCDAIMAIPGNFLTFYRWVNAPAVLIVSPS